MAVVKNIGLKVIAEIIIMNFMEVKKKENLEIKSMANSVNASINIKKQGLKILSCGSGIESQDKQKRSKALPLGESVTSEAHPISFAVGG